MTASFMSLLGATLMTLTRIRKRRRSRKESKAEPGHSFQPSVDTDDPHWSRFSLPARPPNTAPPPSTISQPFYTQHMIDIPHIGATREQDTRQRLQSMVSTLSVHTLPAIPSSDALDHHRADRIGSVDGMGYFSHPTRPSIATLHSHSSRKKSGISTLASISDPSVASFTIEHAQYASLKVRKVSEGGYEEMLPPIPHGLSSTLTSPHDLDERFSKPIALSSRPPSRIDFTEPFPFQSRPNPIIPPSHPFSRSAWQRESLLPYMHPEPALPSSKVGTPTDQLEGNPYRNSYNGSHPPQRLPTILHSPKSVEPDFSVNSRQRRPSQTSSAGTHKRSASGKEKRRPDSIVLAHLRSPKTTAPSPTLTRPLDDDLSHSHNIASSVMALKSAGGSTNFPYSIPVTPSSGSKNGCPKTPRTATSDGCMSALSDIESAQLFQAWKGFAPTGDAPIPVPAITRGLSVQDGHQPGPRPKIPRRAGTKDGDIDIEIALTTDSPLPPSQSRPAESEGQGPVLVLTPYTAVPRDKSSPTKAPHSRRSSLTPSISSIGSTSSKGKITSLSDVIKEQESSRRMSMICAGSA